MNDLNGSAAVFPPIDLPPDIARQRVLTEKDAAAFVGLSHPSLERLRKAGTAPRHVRLSDRRLGYRICDLLAWLDARASSGDEAA